MSEYKLWQLPYDDYVGDPNAEGYIEGHVANKVERVIEIPWALSCVGDAERVLDVGNAYSEGRWYQPLKDLNIKELWGVDATQLPARHKAFGKIYHKQIIADMRYPCQELPYDYFDVILCVSTIEHIGFNNSMYFAEGENFKLDGLGDVTALANMMSYLKPGGRMVITAPYGKWDGSIKGFRHYDRPRFKSLYKPYTLVEYNLFQFNGKGWRNATEEECANKTYGMYNFSGASAIVCVVLTKD